MSGSSENGWALHRFVVLEAEGRASWPTNVVPKPNRSATTGGVVDLTRVEAVVSDGVDALGHVAKPGAERL